jgi:hypothetical protein
MALVNTLATGLVVALVPLGGCGWREEALPPPPRPALFQEPSACIPLPPPPMMPPESAPLDPRKCLDRSWSQRGLPVWLTIVDGRVTDFEFYDQCSGERFDVSAPVRECIRTSLASWRYVVWSTCSNEPQQAVDVLYLQYIGEPIRVAGAVKHGCAG